MYNDKKIYPKRKELQLIVFYVVSFLVESRNIFRRQDLGHRDLYVPVQRHGSCYFCNVVCERPIRKMMASYYFFRWSMFTVHW